MMVKNVAYIRVSTEKQDVNNQKLEILEYCRSKDLKVDEFIEVQVSSKSSSKDRRIDSLLEKLQEKDTLIVTELSRLGRSTVEVISLINHLIEKKVCLKVIKQNLEIIENDVTSKIMVTFISLFSELERDLISHRTKEALASKKKQGVQLGKPIGTIQKSKFDKDKEKIVELLKLGLSVRKITKILGYNNHISLNTYINKRKLKHFRADSFNS